MKIEFFCGSGGVGKTTLSATRALSLAQNQRVLLMTIDPSLRLKDILHIQNSGQLEIKEFSGGKLYCMLLNTEEAMNRILSSINTQLNDHRILALLAKPFGGLNEILAMVELGRLLESHEFDTVIIDTPPGGHFLEFLDGLERINNFFDETFVQVVKLFNNSNVGSSSLFSTGTWFKNILQTGLDKLLDYLSKVTGQTFVHEFVETLKTIYKVKDKFVLASKTLDEYGKNGNVHFYLVTNAEHDKAKELQNLRNCLTVFSQAKFFALINYCAVEAWEHDLQVLPTGAWKDFTSHLKNKHTLLLSSLKNFDAIYNFPQIFVQPKDDVSSDYTINQLIAYWNSLQRP
jgi:anion-transporting  ArsA/GET3 family ATPase